MTVRIAHPGLGGPPNIAKLLLLLQGMRPQFDLQDVLQVNNTLCLLKSMQPDWSLSPSPLPYIVTFMTPNMPPHNQTGSLYRP